MTKSFYIILTAVAVFVVLFLMGQWIGRSYSLTKDLLARQVYEAFAMQRNGMMQTRQTYFRPCSERNSTRKTSIN